jgi:hypothetical protein
MSRGIIMIVIILEDLFEKMCTHPYMCTPVFLHQNCLPKGQIYETPLDVVDVQRFLVRSNSCVMGLMRRVCSLRNSASRWLLVKCLQEAVDTLTQLIKALRGSATVENKTHKSEDVLMRICLVYLKMHACVCMLACNLHAVCIRKMQVTYTAMVTSATMTELS